MARQVLPIVGAIVGTFFGAPQIGYMIGSIIGNAVDPQIIKGPSIGDGQTQTSREGVPRPIVYGAVSLAGNLMDRGPIIKSIKRTRQSKGGPVTEEERMHLTYAIRICEGPIDAVLRIWEDEKLVYDIRKTGAQVSAAENVKYGKRFKLYLGKEDQNPDPSLEVIHGAGNTPAYPGTAYIVFGRNDVTDRRGSVPNYRFEVARKATVQQTPALFTRSYVFSGDGPTFAPTFELGSIALDSTGKRVDMSYDGDYIASASLGAGPLRVYKRGVSDFTLFKTLTTYASGQVQKIQYSPNGDFLAVLLDVDAGGGSSTTQIDIYNAQAGSYALVGTTSFSNEGRAPRTLAWSPSSREIAVGYGESTTLPGNYLVVFSVGGGGLISYNRRNQNSVSPTFTAEPTGDLAWSSAGFIAGGNGNRLTVFSTDSLQPLVSAAGFSNSIAVRASRIFVVDSGGSNVIRDYEYAGSTDLILAATHASPFTGVSVGMGSLSGDGAKLAVSAGPATISQRQPQLAIFDVEESNFSLVGVFDGLHPEVGDPEKDTAPGFSLFSKRPPSPVGQALSETMGTIVLDIGDRCGLPATAFDLNDMADVEVRGFLIAQQYSASNSLRALQNSFFFDPSEYGEQIHLIMRGGAVAKVLTIEDLVDDPYDSTRKSAIEYPRSLDLMYQNATIGYDSAKATATRNSPSFQVSGSQSVEVPVVLTETEAAQIADKQLKVAWAEAEGEVVLSVSTEHDDLVASDCVGIVLRGTVRRIRVEKIERADGVLKLTCKLDRQSAYTSNVTGIPLPPPTPPPPTITGPTIFEWMNLPALIDNHDALIYYVIGTGKTDAWYGSLVQRKIADGEYADVVTIDPDKTMGYTLSAISAASEHYPDTTNAIEVQLYSGDFEAVTQETLLRESNAIALLRADGTGEILQFRDVEELGPGHFKLSYLLRGRLNSQADSHSAGTIVALLQDAVAVPANSSLIGQTLYHRAVSYGQAADEAFDEIDTWAPALSQTEFPVDLLKAVKSGSTLNVSWSPRERFGTDVVPVRSVNWQSYGLRISDGTHTIEAESLLPSFSADVSEMSGTITVQVWQRNRITGAGPITSATAS